MYNIELYIEELVLHGFPPGDRYHIGDAINRELSRLFAEHDISSQLLLRDGTFDRIDAGEFTMSSDARPENIGTQIAQSLYRGLNAS